MDNWLQVPDNHKLWIDTDIGNDVDDVLALLCCLIMYGKERLIGISTTFYLPEQKARIAKIILEEYNCKEIPVYAGLGMYHPEEEGEQLMKTRYRYYPTSLFGVPWSKDSLAAKESKAYRDLFPRFENININYNAIEALAKAIEKEKENLVILSIGFPTNIAEVMDVIKKNKVNRIVIMGGWFEDEEGNLKRLGYNTAVDIESSKIILEQQEVNVLIVSSEFCSQFFINQDEYNWFIDQGNKIGVKKIAKAISDDMEVWMNRKGRNGIMHIGDPIAAYLARHPEEIKEAVPVQIKFGELPENVDMFSLKLSEAVSVKRVETSNILVVKSVKNPEKMKSDILHNVQRFYSYSLHL